MDISAVHQKLYSRSVSPSVEGHLRQEKDHSTSQLTRESLQHVNKPNSTDSRPVHREQSSRRAANDQQHHRIDRDAASSQQQETVQTSSKNSAAAVLIAEQMNEAKQRSSQVQRRVHISAALASHRGQRANQSYLSASEQHSGRMIDELV